MQQEEAESFCPSNVEEWRAWLTKNHQSKQSVWLIYYKKGAGVPSITWSEAVDQALCFGWIDSTAKAIDEHRFRQFFCKRKPTSVWSKINKEKVQRLIKGGLMAPAGLASIDVAKKNGSWAILDEAEELIVPKDLSAAFRKHKRSKAFFTGLSKSVRKAMLQRIVLARRPETWQKRISEIAERAAKGMKPKQF